MVAVMTGLGLGVERGSGFVLGSRGQLGSADFGRLGENVYVNAATGNLAIQRNDELLIGVGEDASIGRAYNSLGTQNDDNGDNWRLTASRAITGLTGTIGTAGSTITRIDWDGSDEVYTYDTSRSAYVCKQGDGTYDTILANGSGAWIWDDGSSRATETYDKTTGHILTSSDGDAAVSYSYTGALLTRVTTSDGEYTTLSYSGNNLTQLVTTLSGGATLTRVRYTYDASNRLSTVTTDLSPSDNVVADGKVVTTTYTYDGTSKRVASISQTGGARLDISYVLVGTDYRVASLTQAQASGVSSTTGFSYDTVNRVTTITDPMGQVSKLTYDAQGQLTRLEQPAASSGATAQVSTFAYNANGDVTSVTDAAGDTTTYQYDANGNLVFRQDAAGNTTTWTYDTQYNQVLTETQWLTPDPDGAGSGTYGTPVTTRYAYTAERRLNAVISDEGRVTQYNYNASGQVITEVIYAGAFYDTSTLSPTTAIAAASIISWGAGLPDRSTLHLKDLTYDFRGNLSTATTYTQETTPGVRVVSPDNTKTTYTYDQFGSLLTSHVAGAGTQTFLYDGLGRLIGSTDLAGASTSIAYTDATNTQVVTAANGATTTSVYDLAGELISTALAGSDVAAATTLNAYDSLGQLRMTTNALGQKSYFLYDNVGRKVADIAADGTIVEYVYDAADRLAHTIDYNIKLSAAQLASLVDANGKPTNVTLSTVRPATDAGDRWYWNIYDHADRLIETINSSGIATVYAYDAASRLISTTGYATALVATGYQTTPPTTLQLPAVNATRDRVTRNFYSDDGLLVGTLDGSGALTQFVYDSAGRQIRQLSFANFTTANLRASGTFAQLLASVGTNAADQRTDYVYDDQGSLRYTIDANAKLVEYYYDPSGNLLHTLEYTGLITPAATYSFAYVQGQITTLNLGANANNRITRSVYDTANRLAYSIDAGGTVTAYSYDALSSVVKQVRFATLYTTAGDPTLATMQSWATTNASTANQVSRILYDGLERPVFAVDAEGYVTETQYDTLGRVAKTIRYAAAYSVSDTTTTAQLRTTIGTLPADAVVTSFAYDALGQLTDETDGTGVITHFQYNAFGEVIRETVAYGTGDASATATVYDHIGRALSITYAADTTAASSTYFSYDALGNLLTSMDSQSVVTTNSYDALGRVTAVSTPIDSTTSSVTHYQYDAFGNRVKTTDPRGNVGYAYYDNLDRMVLQVDPEGYATATSYSIDGAVNAITHYATRVSGTYGVGVLPTITTSAQDETTSFTLDKLDRVTQVTDAEGNYEQYTLDAFGNRVSVRNKLGGVTTNVFDHRNLLVSETLPEAATRSDGTVEAASVTNSYSYDARGNRIQMIEAAGLTEQRTTTYAYDKMDRLISKTGDAVPVQNADHTTTSLATPVETFKYDKRGNLIEHKDAAGARTLTYYDADDRKIAEVSALGTLSTWTYNFGSDEVKAARIYGDAVALPANAGGTPPAPINTANYRETQFAYDKLQRLTDTLILAVDVGSRANGVYSESTQNVTTHTAYDMAGNVVSQTDGRGNTIYSFYDKAGRKIAQVDQENYLTTYDLDADGNVLTQTQYATRLPDTVTVASDVATLKSHAGSSADDRITAFTYDRNGNRKSEARLNMVASSVSASGVLTTSTQTATVSYAYNGIGLVTRKTEANGDYTDFSYDSVGRLIESKKSGYTDYTGAAVRPTTDLQYDGLNNLVRQAVRGTDNGSESDDRITRYSYDKAGRLTQTIDPDGAVTNAYYDIADHLVKQSWVRTKSDGTTVTEASFYSYDLLGHETSEVKGTFAGGTSWTFGDSTDMRYDVYGEMVARGVNTGGDPAKYQEFADYDKMGRVWRTNFGDGIAKAYVYDANGNATLLLQSTGSSDLRSMTLADMVAPSNAGAVTQTQSVFDKRNQLVETVQPSIENAAQLPGSIQAFDTVVAGSNFSGGAVSVGSTRGATGGAGAVSGYPGGVVASKGSVTFDINWTAAAASYGAYFSISGNLGYGGGAFHLFLSGNGYSQELISGQSYPGSLPNGIYILTLYQDGPTGSGEILVAQSSLEKNAGSNKFPGSTYATVSPSPVLQFQAQDPRATSLLMFVRPSGSPGAYKAIYATPLLNSAGAAIAGYFSLDPSAPPFNSLPANNSWDILYYAMDGAGDTLNSQQVTLSVDGAGNASFGAQAAQLIGGGGKSILTNESGTDFLINTQEPAGTQSVRIRYRIAGSGAAWSTAFLSGGGYGQNGVWDLNVTGWGGPYEYWLESFSGANAAGSMLGKSYGTFSVGGQPSALTAYADQPETVHIFNQPAATAMKLWYKPAGTSSWIQVVDPVYNAAIGAWDWDANSITPDKLSNYDYDFRYETYSGSAMVDQAHGEVRLGYDPYVYSNIADVKPDPVVFAPPQSNAATLVLNYRPAVYDPANPPDYSTITLPKSAAGDFEWNVDAIRPLVGSDSYEYFYDLYDGAGNLIAPVGGGDHAQGYVDIAANLTTTTSTLQWVLVGSPDPAAVIDRKQSYDAFGEIISETDGNQNTTNMAYNVMGKLITKTNPLVDATDEHGVTTQVRPTEHYYYDIVGRLVAVDDAKGNRNTLNLLAGSGEDGGGDAVTLKEFHADGGIKTYGVDVFGDTRKVTDEIGAVTLDNYDKMDRLTQVVHPTRVGGNSNGVNLTDNYVYDELGQRIKHWNSELGNTDLETTDYDLQNRIVSTKDFVGNVTGYAYSWSGTLATSGMAVYGGWIKTTNDPSGHTASESDDYFGRIAAKTDFGAHTFSYAYDKAGRLSAQTGSTGQSISYSYYGNGYIRSITDNALHMLSTFEYDKEGNRTLESYTSTDTGPAERFYQVAHIDYDAMNRIIAFTDAKATITYKYDADNNRREVLSHYHDGIDGAAQDQDYWYDYDSMNRFVVTMGTLSGGLVQKGATGVAIGYDQAGNRKFAINGSDGSREDYTYTADGYLEDTKINNVLAARRVNDAMGRVTTYTEYLTDGTTSSYSRASTYDADNRVTDQVETERQSSGSYITTNTHNDYRADIGGEIYTGADQGVITHSRQQQQGSSVVSNTVYGYQWWDDAKQITIQVKGTDPSNPNAYNWAPGASELTYDVNGHLSSTVISGAASATMTYTNDAYGQVLVREEKFGSTIGPRELYYYFDGNRIGDVGNDGPSRVDYASALAQRDVTVQPGAFRYGKPVASADFDENYEPIGPDYPGQASSDYTVRNGDTLSSIAQTVWGDSSLWYLIADANGLTISDTLQAGEQLSIPNKVTNIHNRSGVYRVYNPGEAIGDDMPILPAEPAPPSHNHCGILGQLILVAVAVAVSVVSYGALTDGAIASLNAAEAGALAGAAGSVASQAVGVATGIQDKFSFKSVALSALAGGVGSAAGSLNVLNPVLNGATGLTAFAENVARGALTSVVTQGVAVATGLQKKFDWTGVAAAGVGSGIGGWVDAHVNLNLGSGPAGMAANHLVSGAADAIASAATRSLIDGSDFGDNIVAALPDVIGSTIGNLAAGGIQSASSAAHSDDSTRLPLSSKGMQLASIGKDIVDGLGYTAEEIKNLASYTVDETAAVANEIVVNGKRYSAALSGMLENLGEATTRAILLESQSEQMQAAGTQSIFNAGVHAVGGWLQGKGAALAAVPGNYNKPDFARGLLRASTASTLNNLAPGVGSAVVSAAFGPVRSLPEASGETLYGTAELVTGVAAGGVTMARSGIARIGASAAETAGPRIIEGIDARTLARSHSIEGSRSIRNVDQMSDIMRNDGYAFDPIDVIEHDGGMIIVDGHHRAAAAIRTNTPATVRVVGPDQFPMGSGGWQSIEEVIQASQTARPNRLNPPGRRR
jgi:large repetitive protein